VAVANHAGTWGGPGSERADRGAGAGLCTCSIMVTFAAGGEEYGRGATSSYGIRHPACASNVDGAPRTRWPFDYPAKSGVRRTLEIEDAQVVRAVRALLRRLLHTTSDFWCAATYPDG